MFKFLENIFNKNDKEINEEINKEVLFKRLDNLYNFPFNIANVDDLYLALFNKEGIEIQAKDYKRFKVNKKDFENGKNLIDICPCITGFTNDWWGWIKFVGLFNEKGVLLELEELKKPIYVGIDTCLVFRSGAITFRR